MKEPEELHPPRWPLKLLRVFVKKQYLEEIEGDMAELFADAVEQMSYRKAKRAYTWEILKLFRPILIKNLDVFQRINQGAMFQNYFKISIRGLMKNPLNSFINVVGLSIAIGICIFAYAFARFTYNTDQFHKHKNEVYLATFFANRDGASEQFGKTPRPLGEMLKADFPQISKVCRVEDRNVVVKHKDNVFYERVRFTDPEFLAMFTFPLKEGTAGSLADVNSIILSKEMALKYFGEENPLGQMIFIKFDKDRSKEFKVTGVAEAFPEARTIDFQFLINFDNLRTSEANYDFHDWASNINATLIQVDDPSQLAIIKQGMEKYRHIQNEAAQKDWAISAFSFEPLATLHQRAGDIRDDISRSSSNNQKSIIFMGVIAVFMLALACFNYINIAIVSATKRLKEIGVRKSIGATRRVVFVQFLSENMIITCFALVLGLIFGLTVIIPWFEGMWEFSMEFKLNDKLLWIYLPCVLLLTGIASGIYPAFFISKFQVAGILKGSVRFGEKNPLTKVFLGVQLVLACILITCGVMFTENSAYLVERPWGYNPEEALYADVPDEAAFVQLSGLMAQNPNVVSISGSAHHLGKSHVATIIHFPDRDYEVDQMSVDPHYFETMGLSLAEGRLFNDHEGSDRQAVVINEEMVKNLEWTEPVGHVFKIDSVQFEVVGVLKEFHSYNFFRLVRPTIFRVADKADYRYLSVKVRKGTELETYRAMQAQWSKLFPETPFQGGFQEDVWVGYKEELSIHGKVWRVIAFVAVLLASLGLYGLMTLNVAGRVREFSIRKVLGAGMKNIAANISNQYLVLFAVALIIGVPISQALITMTLNFAYKYHVPMNYSGVAIAVVILILVLLMTASTQIRKVFKANPVNGLKVE